MEEEPRRVLCLHGWRTNPSVMQFQAQDLSRRLSEACSMHFMAARVEQSEACDPMIGASFPAPYYEHWGLHTDDEEAMNEDICATVRYTADFVARNGPFHAIVGFSQGAGLASLLVALQQRLRLLREARGRLLEVWHAPPAMCHCAHCFSFLCLSSLC